MDAYLVKERRSTDHTTITPLTCFQVTTAECLQGDQWKANNRPLSQVTVVGFLVNYVQEGNSLRVRIRDATGYEAEMQKWSSDAGLEEISRANNPFPWAAKQKPSEGVLRN